MSEEIYTHSETQTHLNNFCTWNIHYYIELTRLAHVLVGIVRVKLMYALSYGGEQL